MFPLSAFSGCRANNVAIRKMAHRVIRFQDGRLLSAEVNETRIEPSEIEW